MESTLQFVFKLVMLEKQNKKFMNFSQTHLLEVGLTKIPGDHETLFIVRHVGHDVDFHPRNLLWTFWPSPSCVK